MAEEMIRTISRICMISSPTLSTTWRFIPTSIMTLAMGPIDCRRQPPPFRPQRHFFSSYIEPISGPFVIQDVFPSAGDGDSGVAMLLRSLGVELVAADH